MKKLSLIVALFFTILLLQNCSKDTVTATASSTQTLFATINDSTWSSSTYSAKVAYNTDSKSKIFSCVASANNKQIIMSVTQTNTSNSAGFPLKTFISDAGATNNFAFYALQKNTSGAYVYVQQGTVSTGSGTLSVSAIDSVKKVITGTFYFTAIKNNYDGSGNIISTSVSKVEGGAFNNMPYTFTTGSL
jgi:outer membrane protein assembly factor BamD (BamD/ComL family)